MQTAALTRAASDGSSPSVRFADYGTADKVTVSPVRYGYGYYRPYRSYYRPYYSAYRPYYRPYYYSYPSYYPGYYGYYGPAYGGYYAAPGFSISVGPRYYGGYYW